MNIGFEVCILSARVGFIVGKLKGLVTIESLQELGFEADKQGKQGWCCRSLERSSKRIALATSVVPTV